MKKIIIILFFSLLSNIINNLNKYFGRKIVEKLRLITFDDFSEQFHEKKEKNMIKDNLIKKISEVKNENLKKSLLEFSKVYKTK